MEPCLVSGNNLNWTTQFYGMFYGGGGGGGGCFGGTFVMCVLTCVIACMHKGYAFVEVYECLFVYVLFTHSNCLPTPDFLKVF